MRLFSLNLQPNNLMTTASRLCEPKFSQLQMWLIGAIISLNSLNRARYSPHSKT
ncbi:hypothetical protein Lspi_2474 [Legionella spiritensis]|uniref:Uncharacterized protein n=1 Tax=Legionella spiritensis TaxID=452 RepID=A0A0W0YY90_LEGSP|nr:hypothetical protein Lspi_2474 [Legionella spiritensis]SNV31516.1 Uncharacterised protein [Legionella spiritensis]